MLIKIYGIVTIDFMHYKQGCLTHNLEVRLQVSFISTLCFDKCTSPAGVWYRSNMFS